MAREHDNELARIQVPVSRALADKVAAMAKGFEWTQARMAAKLLELAVSDLSVVGKWLARRVSTTKRQKSWLLVGDTSEVRLQLAIGSTVSEKVNELAVRLNHTPVRMAALLLDIAIADNDWTYRVMSTGLGLMISRAIGKTVEPYESAEISVEIRDKS